MRLLGSWCERIRARRAVPLMAALVVMATLGQLGAGHPLAGAAGWIGG
jgi:hypothetical protein